MQHNPRLARGAAFAAFILVTAGCATGPSGSSSRPPPYGPGMAGRGFSGPGMMGGTYAPQAAGPGEAGFVAGTPSAPRVVWIIAGPGPRFAPADVAIAAGETITFEVTTMGPAVHEFKVGPVGDVTNDAEAAPEVTDIGMMQTKSLTYTFTGSGPFAFACHEPGHFEAGMRGTISIIG